MSLLHLSIKKIMDLEGVDVQLYKRKERKIDHQIVYEYSEPIVVRTQIGQIIAYDFVHETYGLVPTGDFLATFLPEVDIREGDKIVFNNMELNVENVIERLHKGQVIYKEAVLRKIG